MLTTVKGTGYTIEQVQAMILSAEKTGQRELASMLKTCLKLRLKHQS
jgi:hypothetical protein